MSKLTKEEVLHVAKLAKLELTDEEIEKYSYELKEILDEIEKINDISIEENGILIAPWSNDCSLREDISKKGIGESNVVKNAPKKLDNFIEVRGVFND